MLNVSKKIEQLTKELYKLRVDLVKGLADKQAIINNVNLNTNRWAETQFEDTHGQVSDLQEAIVDVEFNAIMRELGL